MQTGEGIRGGGRIGIEIGIRGREKGVSVRWGICMCDHFLWYLRCGHSLFSWTGNDLFCLFVCFPNLCEEFGDLHNHC